MGKLVGLALIALLASGPTRADSLSFPMVGTGQSRCYDQRGPITCPVHRGDAFHGQDAQAQSVRPAYGDNGDGTVTDSITGLMWEKSFRRLSFAEAEAAAGASRTGGHGDWRVPTIKELYSLINFDGSTGSARPEQTGAPADARPYLDASVFAFEYPRQGRFIDAQYVSRTTYLGTTMGRDKSFFGVNFADGRIKAYPQDGGPGRRQWYARFVRGPSAYGVNRFHDDGDGTVSDAATGLVWTRADSGDVAFRSRLGATLKGDGRLDWREALAFCDGLEFAGHRDWRLPDAKVRLWAWVRLWGLPPAWPAARPGGCWTCTAPVPSAPAPRAAMRPVCPEAPAPRGMFSASIILPVAFAAHRDNILGARAADRTQEG
ncbi:MAG: DUF1566 domain-containing protein [Magnetospirillum sp.]|nr:DUF1566 domain-containing protein [Magnetospirillum sp.]